MQVELEKFIPKILQHEDLFADDFITFLGAQFVVNQTNSPVIVGNSAVVNNTLAARIDNGRWVVDCPSRDPRSGKTLCTAAMATSSIFDLFVCPVCGSPENGGRWYEVVYPAEREEIERLLLMRPDPGERTVNGVKVGNGRFWSPVDVVFQPNETDVYRRMPGQTIDELRAENLELGFGV